MPERIRFHLDEHIDPDVARALRQYGVDVTTTVEAGLRSASDRQQLDFARREKRVLVTHDADFLRMIFDRQKHHGIVYCSKTDRSMGEIIRTLILIYEVLTPEEITDRIEFI